MGEVLGVVYKAEAEARIEELIKLIPSPFCKLGRCQICDARRKAKRGRS
jgi:hypothetical protein